MSPIRYLLPSVAFAALIAAGCADSPTGAADRGALLAGSWRTESYHQESRVDTLIRANKDGTGTDYTLGAQIGATYWINRFVGLDARLRHEFLTSQVSTREYNSNSIYLGVKVQR